MEYILGLLLSARTNAHILHWHAKTFSVHMALGELYETLTEFADQLAEMYTGAHGEVVPENVMMNYRDPLEFINFLFTTLNTPEIKATLSDSFVVNKFEELLGDVSTVKYKLEQLK